MRQVPWAPLRQTHTGREGNCCSRDEPWPVYTAFPDHFSCVWSRGLMVTVQNRSGQGVAEFNYWLLCADPRVCLYEQDELKQSPRVYANDLLEVIVIWKALRKLYLYCEFKLSSINSLHCLTWFLLLWNLLDPAATKLPPHFVKENLDYLFV